MSRNKIEDKKVAFGITLNPDIYKLLIEHSKKDKKSKSKFIEDIIKKLLD